MSDEVKNYLIFHTGVRKTQKLQSGVTQLKVELETESDDEDLIERVAERMNGLKVYGGETLTSEVINVMKSDFENEKQKYADLCQGYRNEVEDLKSKLSFVQTDLTNALKRIHELEYLERGLSALSKMPV